MKDLCLLHLPGSTPTMINNTQQLQCVYIYIYIYICMQYVHVCPPPPPPLPPACGINVHKRCERMVPHNCGINQRDLARVMEEMGVTPDQLKGKSKVSLSVWCIVLSVLLKVESSLSACNVQTPSLSLSLSLPLPSFPSLPLPLPFSPPLSLPLPPSFPPPSSPVGGLPQVQSPLEGQTCRLSITGLSSGRQYQHLRFSLPCLSSCQSMTTCKGCAWLTSTCSKCWEKGVSERYM